MAHTPVHGYRSHLMPQAEQPLQEVGLSLFRPQASPVQVCRSQWQSPQQSLRERSAQASPVQIRRQMSGAYATPQLLAQERQRHQTQHQLPVCVPPSPLLTSLPLRTASTSVSLSSLVVHGLGRAVSAAHLSTPPACTADSNAGHADDSTRVSSAAGASCHASARARSPTWDPGPMLRFPAAHEPWKVAEAAGLRPVRRALSPALARIPVGSSDTTPPVVANVGRSTAWSCAASAGPTVHTERSPNGICWYAMRRVASFSPGRAPARQLRDASAQTDDEPLWRGASSVAIPGAARQGLLEEPTAADHAALPLRCSRQREASSEQLVVVGA